MSADGMTRGERETLASLARKRAKLAKMAADERAAVLLADFEQKSAAIYIASDDPVWRELHAQAARVVAEADRNIAARCRELGIPENFRPGLNISWYGRGENAAKDRRAELRLVARTTVDALTKKAKTEIERRSLDVETRILSGGLESGAAQAFLASMPTADALMPFLDVSHLEAQLTGSRTMARLAEPLEDIETEMLTEMEAEIGSD